MSFLYKKAALGGTFDHFHRGHRALIDSALNHAEKLVVGLTREKLYSHKPESLRIQSYEDRLLALEAYFQVKQASQRVEIIPLEDVYGTTLTDSKIDCLVVSEQTKDGALAINQRRRAQGWQTLPIIVAAMELDSQGQHISSTGIRAGRINRDGLVFLDLFSIDLKPSQKLRIFLSQVQGKLNHDFENTEVAGWHKPTVLVGDYVTQWWLDHKLPFSHAVVDGLNRRAKFEINWGETKLDATLVTENPAGSITSKAAKCVLDLLASESGVCRVKGEEDLLAVPLGLFMPLDSYLIYGQPNEGMVVCQITEAWKEKLVANITQDNL